MDTQQIHDTMLGGRQASYANRDGTSVDVHIRQIPFSGLAEYQKRTGNAIELIGYVTGLTPEQVDALDTEEAFRLLADVEAVNAPLYQRWETRRAEKATREMSLMRTQFPALFEKAEKSMLQKMEQAMAAAAMGGETSSTSSETSALARA